MQSPAQNTVPVSLARYVIANNLAKAFAIFLYLKNACRGILHSDSINLLSLGKSIGMSDVRTVKKNFQKLVKQKWVGYNRKTGNYFIRSFTWVKIIEGLPSKHGIKITVGTFNSIKCQLMAGLIGFTVKGLFRAQNKKLRKLVGPSALKRHGAIQMAKEARLRPYCGLSNTQIAKLFGCSKSTANRLKIECEVAGLLQVTKQYKLLLKIEKADMAISRFAFEHPHKVVFRRGRDGIIRIYEQLTDKIVSTVYSKRMVR